MIVYELVFEKIFVILVVDLMVLVFMKIKGIYVVVVGVDRVVVNGDIVNKIGIY